MAVKLTQQQQVDEIIKCRRDPIYFIKNYLYVQHPVKGRVPFTLFPFQEDCIRDFLDYKFCTINKSRQLGISTVASAFCLWLTLFNRDKNVLLMATKLDGSKLMIQKLRIYYQGLPKWMLERLACQELDAESVKYIQFNNGSMIQAITTSPDAGRGQAVSLLIIDEAAHIENLDTLWKGLYPTVSSHPGARIIVFSSPNGKNFFYNLVTEGKTEEIDETRKGRFYKGIGKNGFHTIELPWDVHPERDDAWFDTQARGMNQQGIAQELLCDFAGSSATFFAQELIDQYKRTAVAPLEMRGPEFYGATDLWVWKKPEPNHKYVMSMDISKGDAEDFSAMYIADTTTSEIVAEFLGKIPPDRFAEYALTVAAEYNSAFIINELNSIGIGAAIKLRDSGYENLFYMKELKEKFPFMSAQQRKDALPGWVTKTNNRDKMLSRVEEVLRNNKLKIQSFRFIEQMETFVWSGRKAQAIKHKSDDLIMALAILFQAFDPTGNYSGELGLQDAAWANAFLKSITAYQANGNPTNTTPKQIPQSLKVSYKNDRDVRTLFPWIYK